MSLVTEIVSRLDINIDRYHSRATEHVNANNLKESASPIHNVRSLQATVRALSVDNHGLLSRRNLLRLLNQARRDNLFSFQADSDAFKGEAIDEQSWFLLAKFTTQTLGSVLGLLLEQSSLLGAEIDYWNDVLGSSILTGHYTIQTAPSRIWLWISEVISTLKTASARENMTSLSSISRDWKRFYQIVQNNIQEGVLRNTRNTLSSPLTRCRLQLRQKRKALEKLKDLNASAIGILLEECLTFASNEPSSDPIHAKFNRERFHGLYKTVLLVENTLQDLSQSLESPKIFEETVFLATDNMFQEKQRSSLEEQSVQANDVVEGLIYVLRDRIPNNLAYNQYFIRKHGRPSTLARYWFPTVITLMSLSTSLRVLTNRRAELLEWVSEFGATVVDFWRNWVLQPVGKLIGTIRHDEQSEIAIMSRTSLEADRQSLERMVIDFVSDNSSQSNSGNTRPDVSTIAAQVRDGDLTPVLKAYERDLRKPFIGTIRGDLVRALLIQIQKTKVDVEVAMGGIDALLKSQELVFGFIGLTPGLLITYTTVRWIASLFDSRKGFRAGIEKQKFRNAVRNIDRILGAYPTTPDSVLSYRDYGLCIYEAQILKRRAQYTVPRSFLPIFQQDLTDLTDLSHGVWRQRNALQRIQWTYSKWF
ncbi:conserved hypothetical protein [Talaromyces stipitatus ATCC 10500]|uniref:ATP synthase regulation protein NCA2 n=1 Tax=Talaromyces stipitatus (strain ATCC 10500 / CBS 375.48 / QM 6759 / NRRL 1006) TaxID=441959 RepID=B8MA60_TALSN|nr:uncharacterized protein TSTA_121320 [Talaromyces stipitatus ATCC 10500]EED18389.1 conserved hypothetical protein [Talaromyces stipitatus ATCC 10500]